MALRCSRTPPFTGRGEGSAAAGCIHRASQDRLNPRLRRHDVQGSGRWPAGVPAFPRSLSARVVRGCRRSAVVSRLVIYAIKLCAFRYETAGDLRRGGRPRDAPLKRVEHPVRRYDGPRPADSGALIGCTTRRDAIRSAGAARHSVCRDPSSADHGPSRAGRAVPRAPEGAWARRQDRRTPQPRPVPGRGAYAPAGRRAPGGGCAAWNPSGGGHADVQVPVPFPSAPVRRLQPVRRLRTRPAKAGKGGRGRNRQGREGPGRRGRNRRRPCGRRRARPA
ncbi:hypothetical protein GA0115245_100546 [Streptomyces sp. di188]|nr:hypothetical protein GA0115245_100546 [Streptomyces sp. di188]SCD46443.1 hypothetical protein GA0115238_110044 [Streptomyces sp. di50b]